MSIKGSLAKQGNQNARKTKNGKGNWAIKVSNIITNRRFEKAADAWDWAMWNYKGRNGWKLVIISPPNRETII